MAKLSKQELLPKVRFLSLDPKVKVGRAEKKRLVEINEYECAARTHGFKCVAGVDEAGRGPLAGPVVAAVCAIPEDLHIPGIDDSKQVPAKERGELFSLIKSCKEIRFGVGVVDNHRIDKINIYQATIEAMLQAIAKLAAEFPPDFLLVDGLHLPHPSIPTQKIIKGDCKSQSIAAASIIAKETRDALMVEYHKEWPQYGFAKHKGYGTEEHLQAIAKHGPCAIHRQSFEPIRKEKENTQYDLFVSIAST